MKISIRLVVVILALSVVYTSCASKKRKNKEPSALGKFYHNTTALYNGYFNANEIIKETYLQLEASHQDNYTEILPLYDYVSVGDPAAVAGELDRAIEKVTTVALIHEPSHWVDDCYVLMGHAQYLKQDYESSEETFQYFKEEFDPGNPFGRNYEKKKVSKKAIKKEKEKERKQAQKAKEQEKKEKEKEREAIKKEREQAKKDQKKEREAERKRREREKKERAKAKKKKKTTRSGGKKKRPAKKTEDTKSTDDTEKEDTSNTTESSTKEPAASTKVETESREEEDPRARDEEEDEEAEKEKEKEKKKDKTAYSEGLMWLARTYVKRDKLSSAKYLVRRMKADGGLPDDVTRELPVILADAYIQEKNYEEALLHLDEAIELANKKKNKARYAYVAGQLSEKLGRSSSAADYFANARKWSGDFRMKFMAELNTQKFQMQDGKSVDAVIANLNGMAKERKYADYLDQLYYTMGEIQLAEGDFAAALPSFRKSIQNNTNNNPLKVETYYKLATLFYDKEDYVEAKYHFDSTLTVIDKEDSRYRETRRYAESLTDIANYIETIELQDSLLAMAKLDDTQIRAIAEKMVEEGREAKQKSKRTTTRQSGLLTDSRSVFGKSNFWAYDEQIRNRHAEDFKEVWGDLTLQDDWRRSDKLSGSATAAGGGSDSTNTQDSKQAAVDAMMTDIKKQLPYSAKQKVDVYAVLSSSLFELGKLYRDKLNNYKKAVETHEQLLKRFPSTDKKLDAYYYLYLSNLEKPDAPRAKYYKDLLIAEYPDTEYAKVISDPAYAASLLDEDKKLDDYYQETYASFEAGDYQQAYNMSKASEDKFGKDNPLRPKFSLLNAMALGSIKGKDIYIKALREVVATYPNTPEKARAQEIMRFLQGDASAFDVTDMKEVDDIFSVEDNIKHYVAVVLYDIEGDNMEKAKIAVSEYNKKQFPELKLQLNDSNLNREEKKEVILVRKFKNKEGAMEYYDKVTKDGNDFIPGILAGYSIYAITQRNYRKMVIERSDKRYRAFFNKYYLGNE